MLFLALTLFAFSLILYGSFDRALYSDFDDLLSSRAEGVADSINTYWNTKRAEDMHHGQDAAVISNDAFLTIARNWVEEKRKDPELMSIFVQILNTKGEVVVSSKATPRINAIAKSDFEGVLNGEDDFSTVGGELSDGRKIKFRVYTRPVKEEGKIEYVVQAGGPLGLLSVALGNLRLVLFLLLPLTVLLAGIPGVLLVRLTLRPVDKMVDTIRQITAENLKLKIHMPDTKDEIKRLADTFNDMIERLDRSFSSQQRFIQDISRELKIPVNLLKEELESALTKNCTEAEYRSLLLKAMKETDGFSRTIEDLSILSQFGNERLTLNIRKINLTGLIERIFDEMKTPASEKGVTLSLSCIETIKIDADREQVEQLITNLLDNAIKYTYRKGSIAVAVRRDEKFAKVTVSDSGIGIPEDELPYIFDRFYQVAKPRGIKGGFGLGLSTVKAIVEAHKGTVTVESQEGKGTLFTVYLPINYSG